MVSRGRKTAPNEESCNSTGFELDATLALLQSTIHSPHHVPLIFSALRREGPGCHVKDSFFPLLFNVSTSHKD